jgi:hypothetical protein
VAFEGRSSGRGDRGGREGDGGDDGSGGEAVVEMAEV